MIRLLLVDDHPVVRAGYQRLLEQTGEMRVVAQAGDVDAGCAAFADLAPQLPDVTLTDLSMPGSGGLELIRRLRERDAGARVLVFSMYDSEMLVSRTPRRGAGRRWHNGAVVEPPGLNVAPFSLSPTGSFPLSPTGSFPCRHDRAMRTFRSARATSRDPPSNPRRRLVAPLACHPASTESARRRRDRNVRQR